MSVHATPFALVLLVMVGKDEEDGSASLRKRKTAIFFWRRVRYRADEGESGIIRHAATATRMEGKPSSKKSRRQGAMGNFCPRAMIAHASVLAKLVASGAADIKNPVLSANSSRLKKNDR